MGQLKRSKIWCLTAVSCSHGQNFQLYEYGVSRVCIWSIWRNTVHRRGSAYVQVFRSPAGTQCTDAIVLYPTVQCRSKQSNSNEFSMPLLHMPFIPLYTISIGRVILIRQSETPELRIRADIMDPMLLNFSARADWLKVEINRNRSQSHVFPASVTLQQLNKTGSLRNQAGSGPHFLATDTNTTYPHHPVA